MADGYLTNRESAEKYVYGPPRIRPANFAAYSAAEITRELKRRVQGMFGTDHSVIFEVPVGGRRIDVVAVGRAPHTRHKIHGFEIKSSGADLRNELRSPEKSAPARRVCDRWWLVVPDLGLLAWEKPPPGWGVLVAAEVGLRIVVEPEPHQAERTPGFIAGLVTATLNSHGTCVRIARQNGYRAGYTQGLVEGEVIGRDKAVMERPQTCEGNDAA